MNEQIKVLHITEVLQAAGIESFIMNMYRNIDRNKVQFDFFVTRNANEFYDAEIESLGGRKYTIDEHKIKNVFIRVFVESIQLYKFLKKHRYNIIHVHTCTPLRIFYLFAAKLAGVKTRIYHSHSAKVIGKSKAKLIVFYLLKQFFPFVAKHCFACSFAAAEWMYSKKIIINNKAVIIYNGIDTAKFRYNKDIREKYRKKLGIEQKYVIGHTGRFLEQKNHKFMIEIFDKIHQKNENTVLLLLGRGELEESIKKLVSQKKLDNCICFLGVRSDVDNMLQAMDCYIMPSLYEGLPVAAVEAQCSGLPCVFSENITKEIALTKNIKFLSLRDSMDSWVDAVLSFKNLDDRENGYIDVKNVGYDIKDAARTLINFYFQGR